MIKFRSFVQFIAACAVVALGGSSFAETRTYDGKWADGIAPVEGDDIVIVSGTLTWGASLPSRVANWTQSGGTVAFQTVFGETGFTCFEVTGDVSLSGGKWTHTANSSTEKYRLNVACGGNFTVGEGASIDVSQAGYAAGKGPGLAANHCGGAYGGQGWGNDTTQLVSPCYGSVAKPVNLGTGGYGTGSAGGGAIRLVVAGALRVDGMVLSDSKENVNHWAGSGGSVWLTAQSLSGGGNGRISASGGSDAGMYPSGGGRVAINLTGATADFTGFAGKIVADPCRTTAGVVQATAAGTVYLETAADGEGGGLLIVDRDSAAGTLVTPVTEIILDDQEATFNPKEIVLRNGATVVVRAGTRRSFAVGSRITMDGQAAFRINGVDLDLSTCDIVCKGAGNRTFSVVGTESSSIKMKGSAVVGPNLAWTFSAPCSFDATLLTIASGGVLTVNQPLSVSCGVTVESGGVITHTANTKSSDYRLVMNVEGDMTVEADGKVDAKAKGWPSRVGPGSGSTDWWAGCHGGRGYANSTDHLGVGVCYGSLTQPVELGSGSATAGTFAAAGGGAVRLSVAGKFTNDGVVNANGDGSTVYKSSPGGSVWITCGSIAGAGKIEANSFGDNGLSTSTQNSYCGGGRVAVWLTDAGADFSSYSGTTVAYGARGSQYKAAGGAGTVYRKTGSQAANEGTLIIDNDVPAGYTCWPTEIGPDVTDTEVGSVIVRNGGKLKILAGQFLTVNGDWDASPSFFSSEQGGGLIFAGSGVSHVYSNLTVSAFVCQMPGKEIVFGDGTTLTIAAGGRFQMEGDEASQVVLRSATEETAWNLKLDATAAQSVNRVAATDCDASGGAKVSAVNSTLTRTENWDNQIVVVGQTVTWTGGAGSASWLAAGNWDAGRAPLPTDRIVIVPTAVSPVLTDDTTMMDLTVQDGAVLDLGGRILTVTANLSVAGVLKTVRGGRLVVNGNADFGGAQIDTPYLELTLAGNGKAVQTFNGAGRDFHAVTIEPNAAGASVTGGFSTDYFSCKTDRAFGIAFAPGVSVAVDAKLALKGDGATLALGSTVPGQTWALTVKGVKDVSGVMASDNRGYAFNAPVVWTGAASTDFNTPGNWNTGAVPGADDDVIIGAGTVLARATVSVGTLKLENGANVTIDACASVAGTLYIENGAKLTHTANTASSAYTLNLTIGGELVVEEGAAIDVSGKGKPAGSTVSSKSPNNSGGTYGGRGETHEVGRTDDMTYGSILAPVDIGSGGVNCAGAGAICATVAGEAWIDDSIKAQGGGGVEHYVGSGGSVNLTAAALYGKGEISANGGDFTSDYSGGGGRVAVKLTRTGAVYGDFLGSIEAYSGLRTSEAVPYHRGSAGTVYLETADDGAGRGTVVIDNSESGQARVQPGHPLTDYPVLLKSPGLKEATDATFVLRNTVGFNIVTNATIGNLIVEGTKPIIYLNGHTLKVKAVRPKDWPKDELPSFVVPGVDADGNPGKIIWKQGLVIFVR